MNNLRGLLSIRRMDRVPNALIREVCGVNKGLDKGLRKACSCGSAMWRGWRVIELLRESMQETVLVVVQWVGHGIDGMIP